jgi:hypothetical protein
MVPKNPLKGEEGPITPNLSLITPEIKYTDTSNTFNTSTTSKNCNKNIGKKLQTNIVDPINLVIEYFLQIILQLIALIKAKDLEIKVKDLEIKTKDLEIKSLLSQNSSSGANQSNNSILSINDEFESLKLNLNNLEGEIKSLDDTHQSRIEEYQKEIDDLKEKLAASNKNSSNSSKKGSSDIIKPIKHKKEGKGKGFPGPRKGHKANFRKLIPPEKIDETIKITPESTVCSCGCEMVEASPEHDKIHQQYEFKDSPILIREYRGETYVCPECGKTHSGQIPDETKKAGLLGPKLTAFVANLKAEGNSYSTILKILQGFGVEISRGELSEILTKKVSAALEAPYEEVKKAIVQEQNVGIDETGLGFTGLDEIEKIIKHKKLWVWCFNTKAIVLFYISASRSSDILFEILGKDFKGAIECDFFSAYKKYKKEIDIIIQFCHAHLIRDIKFLAEHFNPELAKYGKKLLLIEEELFILYRLRKNEEDPVVWNEIHEKLRCCGQRLVEAALDAPKHKKAQNMANRFKNYDKEYLNFIDIIGLEPTNNRSEQAMRFIVINRSVSQGIRSKAGKAFAERLWTAKGTCARNNVSLQKYLEKAISAYYSNMPHPSLLDLSNL